MNDEPFMELAVDMVLFLELSNGETVDEDAAVEMMERIAATLQRLEPEVMERFLHYIHRRSTGATTDAERDAIANMAGNLGLLGSNRIGSGDSLDA